MKQEIIEWYTERHYQPHKLLVIGTTKWGFSQTQIESAMIHCYYKIVKEGKKISDIDVARYVRNVCKKVEVVKREKELREIPKL